METNQIAKMGTGVVEVTAELVTDRLKVGAETAACSVVDNGLPAGSELVGSEFDPVRRMLRLVFRGPGLPDAGESEPAHVLPSPVFQSKDSFVMENLKRLLVILSGGPPRKCDGCDAMISFVPNPKSGRFMPIKPDGLNHFIDCPKAARFDRGSKKTRAGAGC